MPTDRDDPHERHLRVLLVEDDAANREVESLMLQHLGHDVEVVADGAAALTAAAAGGYDAILVECHMHGMDGFAATAAIRDAEAAGGHVPIIGLADPGERTRCVEAGMDDVLAKPFALHELEAVLERAAPLPADSFAGVLDAAIVDQLRMLVDAGSSELLASLEVSFARDTPLRIAALRAAIAAADADAIAFNVHTLKGSAANLGALRIVAACSEIEETRPGPERLDALVRELEQAAADASTALAALAASG
jgi:CheY-like chemotaxis protein